MKEKQAAVQLGKHWLEEFLSWFHHVVVLESSSMRDTRGTCGRLILAPSRSGSFWRGSKLIQAPLDRQVVSGDCVFAKNEASRESWTNMHPPWVFRSQEQN
ncbi:hypothetical protein PLANTIT3_90185 [Plantibacter sp. T3]|nr:hypothetical protein PLANTIT3_90185 [Plantibacter sp. T3]